MIEVCDLTKKYSGKVALDGISFKAEKGEILGLLGPNGAGKSTTMNIMTGYISATQGTVTIDGSEIYRDAKRAKAQIGYLPEIPPLYGDMTVLSYLKFVYDLKGVKLGKKEHIAEVMRKAKIDDVEKRLIKNLSKGYKQRVGIAQALIGAPQVLIFDEPTVGLDPAQILETRELIRSLREDHTVIISSHILSEISSVCDRVIVLNKGKIAADMRTSELSTSSAKTQRLGLVVEGEPEKVMAALDRIVGILKITDNGEAEGGAHSYTVEYRAKNDIKRAVFKAMAAADLPILKMDREERSLEQIFLQLTADEKSKTEGKKK